MKYRVTALLDDTYFMVEFRFLGLWWSGFVWLESFSVDYQSKQSALDAIEMRKNRFTEVEDE